MMVRTTKPPSDRGVRRSKKAPVVYSTESGRVCPKCGWPKANCRCSVAAEERVPEKITARLRIEKAGRGGKTVTVVEGLPRNHSFLKELAVELKRALGSGGKVAENHVEIQGDHRDSLRPLLQRKGWVVKG